jgi:hypothetical protein
MFNLLNKLGKLMKTDHLDLTIILKILTYGIFKPKNKYTIEFI